MDSNHFIKPGTYFKLLCLLLTVVLFSYCTTYNTVTSFGKRKYTKGHFFEPVPKVNTAYTSGGPDITVNTESNMAKETGETLSFIKRTARLGKALFKEMTSTAGANETTDKKGVQQATAIAKSTNTFTTTTISQKENSLNDPYAGHNDHIYKHDDSKKGKYLTLWIVLLGLFFICGALFGTTDWATATTTQGEFGCIFAVLSFVFLIMFIVYLVLWLNALAS